MRSLKPTVHLIVMNALYRPGPMESNSLLSEGNMVKKKSHTIFEMEEYLAETYGITVYQSK